MAMVVGLLSHADRAYAQCDADHTIVMADYYFAPAELTIAPGETVAFVNVQGTHNINGITNTLTGEPWGNPVDFFLEETGLPQLLIRWIEAADLGPTSVIVLILVFYVILGCFMDSMSMILLTVPLLAPVALELGFDLVWFGILVVTVAEIGLITPPIGLNLFVVQAAAGNVSQATVVRGILPFILADILRLALLVAFPALVLWLPQSMM